MHSGKIACKYLIGREDPQPWFKKGSKQGRVAPCSRQTADQIQGLLEQALTGSSSVSVNDTIKEANNEVERLRSEGHLRKAVTLEALVTQLEKKSATTNKVEAEKDKLGGTTPGWFRGLHERPKQERPVVWFVEQLDLITTNAANALPVAKLCSELSHKMVHIATHHPDDIDEWVEQFLELGVSDNLKTCL